MGCFNLQGCISQLPIYDEDRVAGILCRIVGYTATSIDYVSSENLQYVDSYKVLPICPIIYGTYDEYGSMYPDKSLTTDLLEKFFGHNIKEVIDAFSDITRMNWHERYHDILSPLVSKRNIRDRVLDSSEYFFNNYCILYEHEDIVKTIIDSNDSMMAYLTRFNDKPENNWSDMYNRQRNLFINNGLNKFDAPVNYDLNLNLNMYSSLLFPPGKNNTYMGIYRDTHMMDLFQNYPDMFKYAFDVNLKEEYLDTLKFYNVLECSQIKMNINRIHGSQFANLDLWNNLMKSYQGVINSKNFYKFINDKESE